MLATTKLPRWFLTLMVVVIQGAIHGNFAYGLEPATPKKSANVLPERVTFNAHIRPIMSNTCFVCHGPDQARNDSGFRLDSQAPAFGRLPSDEDLVGIKPGAPESSQVYLRITGRGEGEQMPPADFRHQLTEYDKALFRKWIEQGADYEVHWAYAPIVRPPEPPLQKYADEVANPIDAFILARLAREGVVPNPVAERATLLRRLSLDLIGLPPTPTELLAFLADNTEQAYVRQVDRLLDSPHFGERMASSWLDLVRFSDTVGFHGDQNQRIFPYRDYVIDSFNNNKPFDQFTHEQIAGDLQPQPTAEQLTATGFLRLNMMTREGGAQPGEYLAKYRADRVRALGTAWLGSTLGCCECHNHKYDPFTAKDFYSLGAFFDDLRQWGVYSDYGYTPNQDLKGFNNDYPFPPETRVKSRALISEIKSLQKQRDAALALELGTSSLESPEFQRWTEDLVSMSQRFPDGWVPAAIVEASTDQSSKLQLLDDSLLLTGVGADKEQVTITAAVPTATLASSLRLEVLPHPTNGGFVGRGSDGQFSVKVLAKLGDQQLNVAWSEADRQNPTKYESGHVPPTLGDTWHSGPIAWQFPSTETTQPHTAIFHFHQPLELSADAPLTVTLTSSDIGRVRLSVAAVGQAIAGWPALSQELKQAIEAPAPNRSAEQRAALIGAYHCSTVSIEKQSPIARKFRDSIRALHSGLAMTMIAQSLPAEQIPVSRVLPRGNWQDTSGELAPPSFPHFLPQPSRVDERRLTRRDLAEWLTSRQNPLTPRHFVNHTWKQFFGSGLSAKLDDLGNQGEWPSHPELLEWLAVEFVDSGWNVKHVIRLIVSSRTYRQVAATRSDLSEIDPYNRLLAQQSPRRLEAEIVRDNALAIAGLLNLDIVGGESVFPYQPDGHYDNIQFPDRHYEASNDDRQYRRGLYMHWQRAFLHPMLVNFDAPARDECAAERPFSNSPQQALTLLNDPTFVEASRVMAERLLSENPKVDFDGLLDAAFLRAIARPPTDSERTALNSLFTLQFEYFTAQPTEAATLLAVGNYPTGNVSTPSELAAWSQVCRVILNLHESITRY